MGNQPMAVSAQSPQVRRIVIPSIVVFVVYIELVLLFWHKATTIARRVGELAVDLPIGRPPILALASVFVPATPVLVGGIAVAAPRTTGALSNAGSAAD